MTLSEPIDTDVKLGALLDAFPVGCVFSTDDAAAVLGIKHVEAQALLGEIRDALAHCPESVQLQRGRGLETKFIDGEME